MGNIVAGGLIASKVSTQFIQPFIGTGTTSTSTTSTTTAAPATSLCVSGGASYPYGDEDGTYSLSGTSGGKNYWKKVLNVSNNRFIEWSPTFNRWQMSSTLGAGSIYSGPSTTLPWSGSWATIAVAENACATTTTTTSTTTTLAPTTTTTLAPTTTTTTLAPTTTTTLAPTTTTTTLAPTTTTTLAPTTTTTLAPTTTTTLAPTTTSTTTTSTSTSTSTSTTTMPP